VLKINRKTTITTSLVAVAVLVLTACSQSSLSETESTTTVVADMTTTAPSGVSSSDETASEFTLTSSAMSDGGTLPVQFTCDGASQSPPLAWSRAPAGTKSFAVLMDHSPGPNDWHWYWTLWGIDSSASSISAGSTGDAEIGTNSVNGQLVYAPPCSKGPGEKAYTFTVFALSETPAISNAQSIDRTALLAAVEGITLGTASMTVTYTRS
jgi:phosphatidylethanolamine-binding protein (PEBP) family uncharacterized protein